MSGICGIIRLDGAPASRAELDPLLETLKRRGPDGSQAWLDGPAALGHTLLATTAEALEEQLPLFHAGTGCTITADVRLDNREELLRDLSLRDGPNIGDGELILQAYLRWGEGCAGRLRGDFAFAIWDPRTRRLFCARDQIGMRQLTYAHLPGRIFVFATEPAAILLHPSVPDRLNEGRIADFLDGLEHVTVTETFYDAVHQLPAAHWLTVDPSGLRIAPYWRLAMPAELRLKSDRDYADAFLGTFETAVERRLRCPAPVGAMLSGGMDSGSVSAIAARRLEREERGPLRTYSVVSGDADCAETRAIRAAAELRGIAPTFISLADIDEPLIQFSCDAAEPFDIEMGLIRAVYLAAHRDGVRVVLDGAGGDVALDSSSNTAMLLRNGQILQGFREARGETAFWGAGWPWPLRMSLGTAAGRAWIPAGLRRLRRRGLWRARDRSVGQGVISSSFASRAGLLNRRRRARSLNASLDRLDTLERLRRLENARIEVGRARYDRVASTLAIEPRDPFLDLDVLQLCLSLPRDQLQKGGWPKVVLRRALAGYLPDSVQWRRGKEHLGRAFTDALISKISVRPEDFQETLASYVNLERVTAEPVSGDRGPYCENYLHAVGLHLWLESVAVRGKKHDCPE